MGRLLIFLLALMLVAAPAAAGTVYRCVGADGIPNYTSKRASNAVCKAVARGSEQSRISRFTSPKTPAVALASAAESTPAADAPSSNPDKQVVFQSGPAGAIVLPAKRTAGATVLRGAVYRFVRDGVVHYTNVPPRGTAHAKILFTYVETCFACAPLPGVNFGSIKLNTVAYSDEIRSAALANGVEEAIVRAIIHAESSYRPNAISHAGAQGLMQLIPATATRFGVSDPFDPGQNIQGGVKYLAWLMKRYSSNLTLVAAAYNAGEGAVDRNGGVPPYSETQRYVQRVGQLADRYRTALAGP
jgi:hypothetical protein